eukprot:762486-Hanusia_phi.AAC.2
MEEEQQRLEAELLQLRYQDKNSHGPTISRMPRRLVEQGLAVAVANDAPREDLRGGRSVQVGYENHFEVKSSGSSSYSTQDAMQYRLR